MTTKTDNYSVVFIYTYRDNAYSFDSIEASKEGVFITGPSQGKKVNDIYNPVMPDIDSYDNSHYRVRTNSKSKGIYVKAPADIESLSKSAEENNEFYKRYINKYRTVDIDDMNIYSIIREKTPDYTEAETKDLISDFNSRIDELIKKLEPSTKTTKEKEEYVLENVKDHLSELKKQSAQIKANIETYGLTDQFKEQLEEIKKEIEHEAKNVNLLTLKEKKEINN